MNLRKNSRAPGGHALCVLLSVMMVAGPAAARASDPAPKRGQPDTTRARAPVAGAAAETKIDLTYVNPGAAAILVVRPRQLLTSPVMQMLPVEVASAAGLTYLGFDPVEVEEVVVFAQPPLAGPPEYGVTLRFTKPFDMANLKEPVTAGTEPAELNGRTMLQNANPMLGSTYMPDDHTLLFAPDATIRRLVATMAEPKAGPLVDRVGKVVGGSDVYLAVDVATLRPMLTPMIQMAVAQSGAPLPEELQQLTSAPNLISAAELVVNLSTPQPSSLVVHPNDKKAADSLERMVSSVVKLQQRQAEQAIAKFQASDDPIEHAFGEYMERMSKMTAGKPLVERRGDMMVVFDQVVVGGPEHMPSTLVLVGISGVLVALLLPALQAARQAARRVGSANNLKQLVLALHMYAQDNETFPAHAICSKDGKPLLSWRVAILPYIEQQDLYEEFHLDEPWDSAHNKTLIERMPEVFGDPNQNVPAGKTVYLGVGGKTCIFDGSKDGIPFGQMTDGMSNTIALVEANADQAVEWTKPADWEFDAKQPMEGLGTAHPTGFNAAFADGSVQFISDSIDLDVLKAMFTRNGGEAIGPH
jgi:prepilin-type processing-associated H-X9-DG protein